MPQVKVTATQVRPSLDVEFYTSPFTEEEFAHINQNYFDTGKLIAQSVVYSDDLLTRIGVKIFDSHESRIELSIDPVFMKDNRARALYNNANGITVSATVETLA